MRSETMKPPRERTYVGAYAICLDAGRILLARLAPFVSDAGLWTLPGGGLNWGESPEEAVLRELYEETGMRGSIGGLAAIFSATYDHAPTDAGAAVHHIGILYTVEPSGVDLRSEEGGSTDRCAWVPLDEAPSLPLIALAQAGVRYALGGQASAKT